MVRFSVLIGLVSTEDRERILETLEALRQGNANVSYEVVIADRRQDDVGRRLAQAYPEAKLIPCASQASLAELRTIAFEHSVGDIVAVTEDHCVPAPGWLRAIDCSFVVAEGVVAVGGCVENALTDRSLDWATFLCEYHGFLPPVHEGLVDDLPGMNVAYLREALAKQPRDRLVSGFWETVVHPTLRREGGRFVASNLIRMRHAKRFSLCLFAEQRYLYSRYYAGRRFASHQRLHRWLAALATPLLPPLLLVRMLNGVRSRAAYRAAFLRATPYLLLFVTIWAAGEAVGYLAGSGDALRRIE